MWKNKRLQAEINSLRAELDRRAQESGAQTALLEQVLATMGQGIIVVEPDDSIPYFNSAAGTLIRPGADLASLTPHPLQRLVREARAGGEPLERLLELDRPHRYLTASAIPIEESRRILVMVDDVTELRRIESVRRDFVAAASHELKTPVASMLASAETLRIALDDDPAAAKRFAASVESAARQLASLVNDLLDLSRLEGRSRAEDEEEVDLAMLAEEETAALYERARVLGIQLKSETRAGRAVGSRADLGLALRNLIDNALRHTSSGGEVLVEVQTVEGEAVLRVVDTGAGIASRDLGRVFERFYRADPARSRTTGGTGLGLAIVRHVVESHGGTVTVQSALGEGTTFEIRLPAQEA